MRIRTNNPTQAFIDALMPRTALADELGLTRKAVDAWVMRDSVPWHLRNRLVRMAQDRGVSPPEGFLG